MSQKSTFTKPQLLDAFVGRSKKIHALIARLAPDNILQAYFVLSPVPISAYLSIENWIASKKGLDLAVLTNYMQNPLDAMMWQKESLTAYDNVMTKIWFDSIAIILGGIIFSIVLHQIFYTRRLAKAAKTSAMPTTLPPAMAINLNETVFKDYLRAFDKISEVGKSDADFAGVDFFRLSVGQKQFIFFRSWPIWMKQYLIAKWTLIACAAVDLVIDPSATGTAIGIVMVLAITSEFVIRNRGYFETEMRKFVAGKSGDAIRTSIKADDNDPSEKILRLHELLKAGALTQDEFDDQKKKILGRAA